MSSEIQGSDKQLGAIGDKPADSSTQKLLKGAPEAAAKNLRAALAANPNRTDTLSPDGQSKFTITDNENLKATPTQANLLDELKSASDRGAMLGAGGTLSEAPVKTTSSYCWQRL